MKAYVYVIYNLVNSRAYVGKSFQPFRRWAKHQTIAKSSKDKYPKHYQPIHAAISKYGVENFSFTIVSECDSEFLALEMESNWIAELKSCGFSLYNLTNGGEGSSGYKHTPEAIAKMIDHNTGTKNPRYGKKHTQESLGKMSDSQKGKVKSDIHIMNMVASRKNNGSYAGSKNPGAKFTIQEIQMIRSEYDQSNCSQLAKKYGVTYRTIWKIVNRISYADVD